MQIENCLLCNESATVFCEKHNHLFYKCDTCQGIFRPKHTFFDATSEKNHYEQHNNDVNELGYQKFVAPIVNEILIDFSPKDKGLDFGSGTGPVISKMLREKDYQVENYDIFFENVPERLTQQYNYISCCEVMEHFHEPLKEFELLHSMLLPNGKLYCKTELFKKGGSMASKMNPGFMAMMAKKKAGAKSAMPSKMGKPVMKKGMSTAKDGMKKPTPMANTSMMGMKKGGMAKGGGIESKGKTKGKMITMKSGGKTC